MFLIELDYKADLSEIDAQMRPHMAFLREQYAAGRFLISGRKIPREGGVILALGESLEEITETVRRDPFVKLGLATYRIVEFRASQCAEDMPKRIK